MNWLGLAEVIGGGALTAFGGGAVGVPLISAGVGTLASGRANDHLQQATQQAAQLAAQVEEHFCVVALGGSRSRLVSEVLAERDDLGVLPAGFLEISQVVMTVGDVVQARRRASPLQRMSEIADRHRVAIPRVTSVS